MKWQEQYMNITEKKTDNRYFVDLRNGCIAIRDRYYVDPDRQGLHSDMECVVDFRMGYTTSKPYRNQTEWDVDESDIKELNGKCAILNEQHSYSEDKPCGAD